LKANLLRPNHADDKVQTVMIDTQQAEAEQTGRKQHRVAPFAPLPVNF
jgi:hypothetical protein